MRIIDSSVPEVDRSSQLSDYPTDLLNSPPQHLEARIAFTSATFSGPMTQVEAAPFRAGESGRADPRPQRETKNVNRHPSAQELVGNGRDHSLQSRTNGTESSTESDSSQALAKNVVQLQANKQATPQNRFTELIAVKQWGWGLVLTALGVAVGLGGFHALEPGHGKTLVAAYLVGSQGTMKHAFFSA